MWREAAELEEIYKLRVAVIPTNKPVIRDDANDLIFKSEKEKWDAVADDLALANKRGQPCLVGTTSVEKSEYLGHLLTKRGIVHKVLNAKFHEMEAEFVALAGRKGALTIATNMAGRGTDIQLGGNAEFMARQFTDANAGQNYEQALARFTEQVKQERAEVLAAGGLHIIGTERHDSRRVDNQLRGRSGRQGDPGSSRFYLSLDDDLMRIFGSDRLKKWMEALKMPDGEAIEHKWISKAVENAQTKVEAKNFDVRKNLLEYDDVMNHQRKAVYGMRDRCLIHGEGPELVYEAIEDVVHRLGDGYMPEGAHQSDYDVEGYVGALKTHFMAGADLSSVTDPSYEAYVLAANEQVRAHYDARKEAIAEALLRASVAQGREVTPEVAMERWRFFEQERYLRAVDTLWKHHLKVMQSLRQGVHLESYGQKDPKLVYKKEGFELFRMMVDKVNDNVTEVLFRAEGPTEAEIAEMRRKRLEEERKVMLGRGAEAGEEGPGKGRTLHQGGTYRRKLGKIGRNDPCPCGSGKKFKKCHEGKLDELALVMDKQASQG